MPHNIAKKIWQYNFSTSGVDNDGNERDILFSEVMQSPQSSSVPGKMHGYVTDFVWVVLFNLYLLMA